MQKATTASPGSREKRQETREKKAEQKGARFSNYLAHAFFEYFLAHKGRTSTWNWLFFSPIRHVLECTSAIF